MKPNVAIIEGLMLQGKTNQAYQVLDLLKPELTSKQYENISSGIFQFKMKYALDKIKQKTIDNENKFLAALKHAAKEIKLK